jgi:hypothetical protein
MKNFFLIIATAMTIFALQSCGDQCDCKRLQTLNQNRQNRINELEQTISNAPTKEDIITEYETQLAAKKKAEQDSLVKMGLSKLNLDMFSLVKTIPPVFKVEAAQYYIHDYEYDFSNSYYVIPSFISNYKSEVLKDQLENPNNLKKFFEANKDLLPEILVKTNTYVIAKNYAKILLPYMNGTAPADRIVMFDRFFKKYGQEEYFIPRDNDEWKEMEEKTKLSRPNLNDEYYAYLFAKRRKANGGTELTKVISEILTFVVKL